MMVILLYWLLFVQAMTAIFRGRAVRQGNSFPGIMTVIIVNLVRSNTYCLAADIDR